MIFRQDLDIVRRTRARACDKVSQSLHRIFCHVDTESPASFCWKYSARFLQSSGTLSKYILSCRLISGLESKKLSYRKLNCWAMSRWLPSGAAAMQNGKDSQVCASWGHPHSETRSGNNEARQLHAEPLNPSVLAPKLPLIPAQSSRIV